MLARASLVACMWMAWPVSANEHQTDHFSVTFYGDQNAAYARVAGQYLEEAFARYKDTFGFRLAGKSGDGEKYQAELLNLIGTKGMCACTPTQARGETYVRLTYGMGMGRLQDLQMTSFHEYYHAVTNRYLPYAAIGVVMKPSAAGQTWCIEGQARFMEYWASAFPDGFQNIVPNAQDDAQWLKTPEKSLRALPADWLGRKNGYAAFVLWHFIVANDQIDFAGSGTPGDSIGVVRKFWEALSKDQDWQSGPDQTRKAMDAALGGAPSEFNTFEKCFLGFTRALLFPRRYFPVGDQTVPWIEQHLAVTQVRLGTGARQVVSGDHAKVEEMGARYFKVASIPEGEDLEITAGFPKDSGYVVSIFRGGDMDRLSVLESSASIRIESGSASGTLLALTRLPGSGGEGDCQIEFASRPRPAETGMLDVVFCIDTTGSMTDDIQAVKDASQEIMDQLVTHCTQSHISLQVGLVTYQDHTDAANYAGKPEAAWLKAWPMTSDAKTIRDNILGIHITAENIGGDVPEDLYAALMCAMDKRGDWQGKPVNMGWRNGAGKIILVMADAPPHDPDFEGRTLATVAARAEALDPVHVYPLLLPRQGRTFLDPAAAAAGRLAEATDGQVVRVGAASELPEALVETIKIAISRHNAEIWRTTHPPYGLYATAGGLGAIILTALVLAAVLQRRRHRQDALAQEARRASLDPDLTGETQAHRKT